MRKLRMMLARFLYGRYGIDPLYHVLMWTAIALMVVNLFVNHWGLYLAELALLAYATFRCFSKNIYRRRRENQVFVGFFKRIGGWFKLQKDRFQQRKTHVFRKCPSCKKQLRLPRVKGRHTVCCPCCRNRFQTKV